MQDPNYVEPKFYAAVIPINAKGEVLLGHRTEDGLWTTPAGGGDPGETPIECAIREAKEEALLEILPDQLEWMYTNTTPNGKPIDCYLFRCGQDYTSPEIDPDKEVKEWRWFHPSEFPKGLDKKENDIKRDTILDALLKFHYLGSSISKSLEQFILQLLDTAPELEASLRKSVIQMATHSEGSDLDTADFAITNTYVDSYWLNKIKVGMENFQHGDVPIEFELDQGLLFLTKVNDGQFSGYFKKRTLVDGYGEELWDTANVRIEKQTIPTLIQLLTAKGWISPKRVKEEPLVSKTSYSDLEYKIKILELLEKITS